MGVMKTICTGLVALSLAVLVGCGSSTGTSEKRPGGLVTSASQKEPLVGTGEKEFTLKPPPLAAHVKQGESKEVKIGIDRGKNFDKDVSLKFDDVPKGVTIEPAHPKIKHGDKEAVLTIKAADDAAVGDFKVRVQGDGGEGQKAAETLELKIDKKG
jgi:uncharacterized membrane protein